MAENKTITTTQIRPAIREMQVNDEVRFPIAQMKYVRVAASELGLIHGRNYRTSVNRADRTISVIREADPDLQ